MTKPFPTPPEAMRDEWLGLPWVVAEVHNMREARIAEALEADGLPVIAPMDRIDVRVCRHSKRTEPRAHPALPGYLFAAIRGEGDWPVLLGAGGVYRVLTSDGRPCLVRPGAIVRYLERLARREPPVGGPDAPLLDPEPGQVLRVASGLLEGCMVEVTHKRGPQHDVLVELCGNGRKVRIAVDRLAAA